MTSPSSDLPRLDEVVDLGSWSRFQPTLARFLDDAPSHLGNLTILLTAPAPVVTPQSLHQRWGLRSLLRRGPALAASQEVPGVVLTTRTDGVEVDLPILDAAGAVLLAPQAQEELQALGWQQHTDVLARRLPDGASAAQAVARVLIEVLEVPHPADLDHLVTSMD